MKPTILAALILSLIVSAPAFAGAVAPTFQGLPKVELSFDLGGQDAAWQLESQSKSEAKYTWQGYVLNLKLEKKGIQQILCFALSPPAGQKLSVPSYTAKVTLPTAGLHSVMVPGTRPIGKQLEYYHANRKWRENVPLYRCLIPENFTEKALTNNEAPLILLTDNKGNNKFCVGWAAADIATRLTGTAEGDAYVLTLPRQEDQPFAGDKIEDALIISEAKKPWMDVETAYAKTFDAYNGRVHSKPPDWAYNPVFCTWYCFSENIDRELILKIAKKSKELGIDTFLIDAGWDKKPGEWWGDLDKGAIGDYIASEELFPDMPGMVKEMHDMGLRVEFWAAPFWQAKGSETYKKTKDWHVWEGERECYELCPKYPGTKGLIKEQFTRIAREYGVDGMWLDTADGVPPVCTAKHEHIDVSMGQAWVDCMSAVRDGLRSVKPDAITEARILHANLNSKVALDVVQCGDSPKSFEMIRLALIHLKPWAYDVVVKNDPMIWLKTADAATVGKFLATMVCDGVPCLSVDFLTAPDWQNQMVKTWLAFYKEHQKTLIKGEFKLFGENYGIPDMMLIGDNEAVVYMKNSKTTEVVLPRYIRKAILLNCTNSDVLNLKITMADGRYEAQSYRPDWTQVGSSMPLGASGMLSQRVPQGGAAIIK